jgi:hydroxypyruvate isomerase
MLTRRVFGKLAAGAMVASGGMWNGIQAEQSSGGAAPQFSVMIWTLNKLGSFEQNLERVAEAGYKHVELVGEFEKWSEEETTHMLARMKTLGLTVDSTAGMRSGFVDPAGGDAFLAQLKTFIPKVQRLECRQIIVVSGKRIESAGPGVQHQAAVETLKRSADVLAAANMTMVIEPIDRLENPPIYLDGVTEGFEIARAVGSPQIKVLYDLYHEQRSQGNLIEKLQKNIDEVGLIHIADVPGRHEPGTGEINYGNVYRELGKLRYKGVIAMEFNPTGDPVAALRKAREEAIRAYGEGQA